MDNIMSHTASNIVVACVDFRFQNEFLKVCNDELGEKTFDYLTYPGASKSIIDKESRSVIFSAIATLVKIHKTKTIVILNHIDCGAYGGFVRFENIEQEISFHKEKLNEAQTHLTNRFPNLSVKLWIYNQHQKKVVEV